MPDEPKQETLFGPSIEPPKDKSNADPYFIVGADDRPTDDRVVALSLGLRAEIKVGDKIFSSVVLAHEVVVLRHYYDSRAGSSQVRISAAWPPALERMKRMTHGALSEELKRMRETFIVKKVDGTIFKSFEHYYGADPTSQLKRLHTVMREQSEAWRTLMAKAMGRLDEKAAGLHPKVRESMATELITEREIEELVLLADPSRKGLDMVELEEVKSLDIALKEPGEKKSLEQIKAEVEAEVIPTDKSETIIDALVAKGLDAQRASAVGILVAAGRKIGVDEWITAFGSKAKYDQYKALLT